MLTLLEASQCQINREAAAGQVSNVAGMLRALGATRVPSCAEAGSKGLEKPAGLSGTDSAIERPADAEGRADRAARRARERPGHRRGAQGDVGGNLVKEAP